MEWRIWKRTYKILLVNRGGGMNIITHKPLALLCTTGYKNSAKNHVFISSREVEED